MKLISARFFVPFLLFFSVVSGVAQDFSNKGKDFWITFPAHVDATGAVMGIYITSDQAASGNVTFGATNLPFSITANGVKRFFLGPNGDAPNTTVYLSQIEGIAAGAGIHVTSDKPIVVYAHIIRAARSGATLVLPTNVWGKEYIVPSHQSSGASGANSGYGEINVVAKDTNTLVEITPVVTTRNGNPAGVPYTITLSKPGDVYQVQFPKDLDISGTKVRSIASGNAGCKPIAVFSATTWSAYDCAGASGGDNLFQQLFPVRSWGKNFITAPFIKKTYDILRVFVADPTTVVTRTENGVTTTLTGLTNNSFYEFTTNKPNQISADKPINVVQYMTSQTCGPSNPVINADPEMVILNPVEQTINNITVFSAHQNWVPPGQSQVVYCYLNIIIKSIAAPSFKINGAAPNGSFIPIPGTAYSYLQEDVTSRSLSNPVQTLTADSNFSAIAYGTGNVESYGYNAGTNVKDQFQFITIKNEYATVDFPATCINSPFNFAITLPYQTTSLKWQFYGLFKDTTIANPIPDSSFVVDGRTIYQYRLPGTYQISSIGTYKVTVVAVNPTSDGCSGEQQIDYDVQVYLKPIADFVWQHTGCVTDSVHFIDNSNGNGRNVYKWKWDFGDTKIDSVKNPVHKYGVQGLFTVKESIFTDIGCLADTTKVIDVSLPPVAKFGVSAPVCIGSNITLTDSSSAPSGTLIKWYWDYGDGRKDTLTTNTPIVIKYNTTGTFTISLKVETQSGCRSVVFSKAITVSPYPVADFSLPAAVCLPLGKAAFTNLSTVSDGTAMKYLWDFGDTKIDSVKDPIHFYTTTGPFNVRLTVTSAPGCVKDTVKVLPNVYNQPKSDFNLPTEVCLRDTTKFTDQSTAVNQVVTKYYWQFGDAATDTVKNPSHRYAIADTFFIRHWIVSDKGCYSDTVTKPHIVNPLPTPDFITSSPLCEKQDITFTDKSVANVGSLVRWQWNLGDGATVDVGNANSFIHNYAAFGSKTVSLLVTTNKGCKSDTLKKVINVHALPNPAYVLPEVCLTDAFAVFVNSSTIADGTAGLMTYQWNFNDPAANAGNPNTSILKDAQHKYSAVGNYNVSLVTTSNAGCMDTISQVLTVNGDKPKADFIVQNAAGLCSNIAVNIQNKSTVNFGSITKTEIYWEWPNAAIKTVDDNPVPDKVYSNLYANFQSPVSKTIQVKFVAYSGGVCVNEIIKDITLNASPRVVFQAIPGICLDATPRLITQASDAGNLAGAGTYTGAGVAANGLYTPTVAGVGTHTLKYMYVTTQGCRDSANQTITVWPRPTASFTVDAPMCETQPTTFRDASVANFSNILTWNWTFGDGTNSSLNSAAPFTHTYAANGTVNVQMQVITDSGCTSVPVVKAVKVNPLPKVDFTLPVVCMPAGKAQFTDKSSISDGTQAQFGYLWNFGIAGATSTLKDPVYYYPAVATYNVKLVVTSKDGCRDSATKQLTDVNPQPLSAFSFTPSEVCLGDAFTFTDNSNPLNQQITTWTWDFGDGKTTNTQNATHTYTAAGSYSVKLYYNSSKGCQSDTTMKTAVVNPYPVVSAGPDLHVLEGGQATIKATATGSSAYQYLWTPASYLSNPNVLQPITKPLADITYTLKVTGAGGCSSSDQVFVKLLLNPEIPNAFSPNGDGINDTWNIKYIDSYPGAIIQVFDRYGKQVFYSTGYNKQWDGTINGKPVPVGVYYYIIDPKNGRQPTNGSVTVVR